MMLEKIVDNSFDIGVRKLVINNRNIEFYFVSGLVNTEGINYVIEGMYATNAICTLQVEVANENEFITGILSGLLGIIDEKYYLIDMRSYPSRSPSEPDNEKVVRGSRDGFTENIISNCALIRRRIRTPKLINKLFKIGYESKTDVALMYIEGLASDNLVKMVKQKLENIMTQELVNADKALEELIVKNKLNPYPLVRYTERPDNVANHLYQGQISILVDNSPSAILLPTTLFEHFEHTEEYRQRPIVGTFLRLLRLVGMLLSLFLVPIWLLFTITPSWSSVYFPSGITGNIPLIMQILIAEIGIEFLRMAAIHTPSSLSTALGVIAGILVGEMAIEAGFFSLEIVLFTAISQIGSYATPSYELALANKISKIFFLLSTYIFKIWGLIGSVLFWFIMLARTKSFDKGYLYPLVPFNFKKLIQIFIRFPKDRIKNE